MINLAETRESQPKIVVERVDGVNIGRITLPAIAPIRWEPTDPFYRFFNALNGIDQPSQITKPSVLRTSLLINLNHNSPNKTYPVLAHERAVSAYFTYNPKDELVIIEWGTISLISGESKLHTYLNRMINYQDRVKQGMKLSSGHIARVVNTKEETYLALLDNLASSDVRITADDPMGKMVNTLHFSGFIPISAEGYIRLPAF